MTALSSKGLLRAGVAAPAWSAGRVRKTGEYLRLRLLIQIGDVAQVDLLDLLCTCDLTRSVVVLCPVPLDPPAFERPAMRFEE